MASSGNSCLPEDIIREILSRIPVQSLVRLKLVCKHWLSLITSSDFVITHCTNWDLCLPGQVLGTHLKLGYVAFIVNKLWGGGRRNGDRRILVSEFERGSGKFVFCFPNEETLNWVLRNGPWHISDVPLILKEWQPGFEFINVDDFGGTMPIWVKLLGVPVELLTKEALSRIASCLGKPKYMDNATRNLRRISYAKVLVEVDFNEKLEDSILVQVGDDETFTVSVEYTWKPLYCKFCRCFRHEESGCSKKISLASFYKKPGAIWVPKTTDSRAGCSRSRGGHQKS